MIISSRTPEGQPNHCPVCGSDLRIEPSDPPGDAPCPRCGHLLWFTLDDFGDVPVLTPTGNRLESEMLARLFDSVTLRPEMRLVLDLGNVQYFSSDTLGMLINFKNKVGA